MIELREVIRRLRIPQGIRGIHQQTGIHRTIMRSLRDIAEAAGWLSPDAHLPTEEQIQEARRKEVALEAAEHPLGAFREEIQR